MHPLMVSSKYKIAQIISNIIFKIKKNNTKDCYQILFPDTLIHNRGITGYVSKLMIP